MVGNWKYDVFYRWCFVQINFVVAQTFFIQLISDGSLWWYENLHVVSWVRNGTLRFRKFIFISLHTIFNSFLREMVKRTDYSMDLIEGSVASWKTTWFCLRSTLNPQINSNSYVQSDVLRKLTMVRLNFTRLFSKLSRKTEDRWSIHDLFLHPLDSLLAPCIGSWTFWNNELIKELSFLLLIDHIEQSVRASEINCPLSWGIIRNLRIIHS